MIEELNFLIPLDFLPESSIALEYAVTVGKELNATLHLVHILEEESSLHKLVMNDQQRDLIRRGASDKLDELTEKIVRPSKLPFTKTVLQGKIYGKIIEASKKHKADLIFMGRTDSSNLKKNITGTNTMHIIKEAHVPVITLRKKQKHPGCSHIVLPLDLTKQTIIKASNAIVFAKMLQARITLITFLPDKRKSIEIKFTQRLDKIRKIFEKLDVKCDFKLIPGSFDNKVSVLNDILSEIRGDVLMIMTQQEMNFTEFFIGSHAQEIINESDFPVLSINPQAGETNGIPSALSEVFINPIKIFDH